MSQENVNLVRSLYAMWGRGDYESSDWAHPEIEIVSADGPTPGAWKGLAGMAEGWRDFLSAWDGFRLDVDEYRELDDEHVLALVQPSGRGRTSGVELERMQNATGAALFWLVGGKVRKILYYWNRDNAISDLGLVEEESMSQESVEQLVRAALRAFGARDSEGWVNCFHPTVEFLLPRNVMEGGSYRGHEGVRRALVDAFETWDDIRFEVQEFQALDDRAVILGRTVNVGKADAPAIEYQSAYLVKMRDGKIAYWRSYQSHAEALDALGLSEQDAHADS